MNDEQLYLQNKMMTKIKFQLFFILNVVFNNRTDHRFESL